MKLKYSAAVALLLWLGVVAWVSAMIVAKPSVRRAFGNDSDSAQIAQLQVELGKNRNLLAMLDKLLAGTTDVDAAPVIATPTAGATTNLDPDGNSADVAPVVHVLSLILTSDKGRRAQVDGQWASLGQRLEDGSRLRQIGAAHVVLEDPAGQRITLRMPAPFADTGKAEASP